MAPTILAVWGLARIISPEPVNLDIAQPRAGVRAQAPALIQAQAPAIPPSSPPAGVRGLDRSKPTRIVIPSVSINAVVEELGLRSDGTLETPSFERSNNAAWYKNGP